MVSAGTGTRCPRSASRKWPCRPDRVGTSGIGALGRVAAQALKSWSVSLCGIAAEPVGEGAGDVETGAGGAWAFWEPRVQPTTTAASTTTRAAAAAMMFRRLCRRVGRSLVGLLGLMPAIAVLPSGKDAAALKALGARTCGSNPGGLAHPASGTLPRIGAAPIRSTLASTCPITLTASLPRTRRQVPTSPMVTTRTRACGRPAGDGLRVGHRLGCDRRSGATG